MDKNFRGLRLLGDGYGSHHVHNVLVTKNIPDAVASQYEEGIVGRWLQSTGMASEVTSAPLVYRLTDLVALVCGFATTNCFRSRSPKLL